MDAHSQSIGRRRQSLAAGHAKAQMRLRNRLAKRQGRYAAKSIHLKSYEEVARLHLTEDGIDGPILRKVSGVSAEQNQADNTLPLGWKEFTDPHSGRVYYHNAHLGISEWVRPEADGKKDAERVKNWEAF